MSVRTDGSHSIGKAPTAMAHPFPRCPLLRARYDLVDSPSGVEKEFRIPLHQLHLKVVAPVGFGQPQAFITSVEHLSVPHEFFPLNDDGKVRTHARPPECPDHEEERTAV